MTTNLFRRIAGLLPGVMGSGAPLLVGTVTTVHSDGTATVTLPGGGITRVRNPLGSVTDDRVFLQGSAITGDAPNLPFESIDI